MGNAESGPVVDDAEIPVSGGAKAIAAVYGKVTTEIVKATIAEYYPETRDHPPEERSGTDHPRDDDANQHALYTIPLDQIRPSQTEQPTTAQQRQDKEAKNLLNKILRMNTEETEATAAVYHYMETNKVDENEFTASARARRIVKHIREELAKGNSKPAYQFLATAKTVLPVLREEAGLQLEAEIFSEDSEDSEGSNSVSEQTAAILEYLDDNRIPKDPIGSKNFPIPINETDDNIFRILEENEEIFQIREQQHPDVIDLDDVENFNAPNVEDMDLEFVENFDLAYSEFLYYHPNFVKKNPELMKNLRIYKLQKLLEHNELLERQIMEQLHSMNEEKTLIEQDMQSQLKEAMKKKAARQTFLESEVNDVHWKTRQIQAKLRWKALLYAQDRAKRQLRLRKQFESIPEAQSREDIIQLIPDGLYSKKLEKSIKASFVAEQNCYPLVWSEQHEEQLREYQVENSMMNSEIAMLNQKLARLRSESNKLEWVQTTLVEMNSATVHKLKQTLEKKDGVAL